MGVGGTGETTDQIQKMTGLAPSMHQAWAPWATIVCPNAPLIMKSFIAMLAGTYGTRTITTTSWQSGHNTLFTERHGP